MNGLSDIISISIARAGWCKPPGCDIRAFSRELPPETSIFISFRETVYICTGIPRMNGLTPLGIATPVCGLVRNDSIDSSRTGRITPLKVASVIALLSAPFGESWVVPRKECLSSREFGMEGFCYIQTFHFCPIVYHLVGKIKELCYGRVFLPKLWSSTK